MVIECKGFIIFKNFIELISFTTTTIKEKEDMLISKKIHLKKKILKLYS